MKKTIGKSILCAMLVTLTACILCIGAFAAKYTCIKSGCNREAAKGSAYCWVHKPTKINSGVSGSGSRPSGSSSCTKHKYTCIKDGCTREADKGLCLLLGTSPVQIFHQEQHFLQLQIFVQQLLLKQQKILQDV